MGMLSNFKSDKNIAYQILREIRLRQWIKNGFVYIAVLFGNKLFDFTAMYNATIAFFAFSFAASFIYIINDISDLKKDQLHPIKKNRPIASGKLSVSTALKTAIVFLSASLIIAALINEFLFMLITVYIALQFAYTYKLKNEIIVDALVVSVGFIIRLFAGGIASGTSISSWLVLFVIGLSLLIAFGKRRGEKTVLSSYKQDLNTRDSLKNYPDRLLDAIISMSASYTIISYSYFIFLASPETRVPGILASFLPETLPNPKWMLLTIPLVIYGVARYLYVIYENKNAESPERALLQDKPLLGSIAIWGIMVLIFYYIFGTVDLL